MVPNVAPKINPKIACLMNFQRLASEKEASYINVDFRADFHR